MQLKTIFTSIACAVALSATAVPVELCYSDNTKKPEWFGTGKSETYDVAMRITDPGMVGAQVTGIKVPFKTAEGISDMSGWLSSELKLEKNSAGKKVNAPDIATAEMTLSEGWLIATFSTPYTIPAEGVYVGYTFTVDDVSKSEDYKKPVAVSEGVDANSFFIHSSKQYLKWREVSSESGYMSFITALVDGEFDNVASGLAVSGDLYFKAMEPSMTIPVEMKIHGNATLENVVFSYVIAGTDGISRSGEVTRVFSTPEAVQFGHSYYTDVEIPESLPKGAYSGTLTIESINGVPNEDSAATAPLAFEMLSAVPVHKPVMEEYTGLWCGFCPRGFGSIEHMRNNYPDDFIALSYHYNDEMMYMFTEQFPSKVTGFPACYLDRVTSLDAYHGTSGEGYGFKQDWLAKRAKFTPVDIHVKAYYDTSDLDLIHVEVEFTCVKQTNAGYKIAYALLADGLSDPKWTQVNNFAGNIGYLDIPEMEVFVNARGPVKGLVFNDVIIRNSDLKGIDESIPWPVETDVTYKHEYSFRASECKSYYGKSLIHDGTKLRAVAMAIDSFGEIANADCQRVTGVSGIAAASADAEVVSVEYYNLNGQRLSAPTQGITVKVETLSDGTRRTTKQINK